MISQAAIATLLLLLQSCLTIASSVYNSTCSGPVQSNLMYNVDQYTAADVGLPGDPPADELLSEAICCDIEYRNYAEPNGFYKFPDVSLFKKVDHEVVTVFYDVVCGIPLFQAPVERSFSDWVADTTEHGWPSFRTAEVFAQNVRIDNSSETGIVGVYSSCGTYVGSFLPDEEGDRYCIDLSCVSGHSAETIST